ncbi:MAG: alpha-ketoglutarate-dependent dioxygenase AlkB [Acidimicrobiia bacterium]
MQSVVWQPSLWGFETPPSVDPSFASITRHQLDSHAWVEHQSAWLAGPDALLDSLLGSCEPRALPLVAQMRQALSTRYGVPLEFDELLLLTGGNQPQPWHQHSSSRKFTNPVVAGVTLGARRSIRLRARGMRGAATSFMCASGDLFVMGGASQHEWDHCVPRNRRAPGPHVRIVFAQSRS